MNNQEAFEQAVAGNWIAESFNRPNVSDGIGKFYLTGTSKGYSTFGDCLSDGQVVFYAAFDDACNREAGYGVFNADDQSITPIESTATLANGQYIDGDVAPIPFPDGGTITGTFNAVAFNAIWEHIWDKDNPHEVIAEQVEQNNGNGLGDNVQDALDNLSGVIADWDQSIQATTQNYVTDLPPPNAQLGDMWTDVGVTGEQYVWEGKYWVSVTGGGLGIDLNDPESLPSNIVRDDVQGNDELYNQKLVRVINSYDGLGHWELAPAGGSSDEGGSGGDAPAPLWEEVGPQRMSAVLRNVHADHTTTNRTQNVTQYTFGKIKIGQLDDWVPDGELESHANAIEVGNREDGTTVQISKNGRVRGVALTADDNLEAEYISTYKELNFSDPYSSITIGGEWADWETNLVGDREESNRRVIAEPNKLLFDNNDNSFYGWKFHSIVQADQYFDQDGWRLHDRFVDKLSTDRQDLKADLQVEGTVRSLQTMQAEDFLAGNGDSLIDMINSLGGDGGGAEWYEEGQSIVHEQSDGSGTFIMDTRPSSMWNRAQVYLYEQANDCGGWIAAGRDAMQLGWARNVDPAVADSGTRTTDMTIHDNGQVSVNSWQKPPTDEKFYVDGKIRSTETIQATDFLDADGNSIIGAGGGGGGGGLTKAEADELYAPKTGGSYAKRNYPLSNLEVMDYTWCLTKTMMGRSWHPGDGESKVDPSGMLGSSADPIYRVYAHNFYKGNTPLIASSDLVEAFTTLQTAVADEDTLEGVKTALTNALGGLIEKFEGMKDDG